MILVEIAYRLRVWLSAMKMDLEQFNKAFKAFIDEKLAGCASKDLALAMSYALSAPGKRLRAVMALEAGELVSLDQKASMLFAFAIEIAHQFSLVHDDLPCLDNDDERRGLPTVHKKFGEATALLAGDALLNLAHETFFEIFSLVKPDAFQNAFQFFSRAIGSEGMIAGQTLEIELTKNSKKLSLEQLRKIQNLKTGNLFAASVLVPFLLSGQTPKSEKCKKAHDFAEAFGFAFQIWDDLEDEAQDIQSPDKNMALSMGKNEAIRIAIEGLNRSPLASKFTATEMLRQKIEQKRI